MDSTDHFRAPLPTEIPSQTKNRTTDQNSSTNDNLPDSSTSSLATRNNQPQRNRDHFARISNPVLARILWSILRYSTNLCNDSANLSWLSIRKEAQANGGSADCYHDSKATLPIWTWKDRPSIPRTNAGEATFNVLPA